MTARRLGAAKLRARLSDRDMDVLAALDQLRLLSGRQVRCLSVADGSTLTRDRRARSMLQRLAELGLVVRMSRSVGGIRAGSQGYVYGLSGLGQAVLAVDHPTGGRHRRVWEASPSFQNHVLAVSELYVGLVEAHRSGAAELLAFEAEPACWRSFAGQGGEVVTLKPDACVRLGIGDIERSLFVEVDLSTESQPVINRKCRVYVAYWQTGLEDRRHGVFPEVLWLVPDERRQARLYEVLRRLPADAQALFTVECRSDGLAAMVNLPENAS